MKTTGKNMLKTKTLQQLLLIAAAVVSSATVSVTAEFGDASILGRDFIENGRDSKYWARLRQGETIDSIDYIKDLMQEFGPAMKTPSVERPAPVTKTFSFSLQNSNEKPVPNASGNSQEATRSTTAAPSIATAPGNSQEQSSSDVISSQSSQNSQEVSSSTSPPQGNKGLNSQEIAPAIKKFSSTRVSQEATSKKSVSSAMQSQEIQGKVGSIPPSSQSSSVGQLGANSQETGSPAVSSTAANSQEAGNTGKAPVTGKISAGSSLEIGSQTDVGISSTGNSQEISSSSTGNSQKVSSSTANSQEISTGINHLVPGSASLNSQEASNSVPGNNAGGNGVSKQKITGSSSNAGNSGNSQEISGGKPVTVGVNSQEIVGSGSNTAGVSINSEELTSSGSNTGSVSAANSLEITQVASSNRSAVAPRQLGPGSPLTAAVMLGAPIIAGALYAGASAPHAPGHRRQDPDGSGDEPYWQRLLGNLRDTASYVEDQVRDFFELEQSRERNAPELGSHLGVVPGGAPPGLIQLNQNQVLPPLGMNPLGAGNLPFGNPALGPNGGLHLRLPYINGMPVFQNIDGLEQISTRGHLERGETAAGQLPESLASVHQKNTPLLNSVGTPFSHTLNTPHLLGTHGSGISNPMLSQGIDPVLQRLLANRQPGLSMPGQFQSQLSYGSQSLPSEQFVRVAETGQVVPLRALHPQILDGLTHPDSVPARRFDGALSRQLNGPEHPNIPGVLEIDGSVRRMDANPSTQVSDRRTGLSPKDSDSTLVSKNVPSSLNFFGVGNGYPPGRRKGPLHTGLQVINGTVQYKADNGQSYLLGVTAGNEKMKRLKRPGRPGKNKKQKLKNQRNSNQNLMGNTLRPNLLSANPALNVRNHLINPFLPQVTSTFAMLPETKAEDFQAYDPLTVQLRSYNHKYTSSEEEERERAKEDASQSSITKIDPQWNPYQEMQSSTVPPERKIDSSRLNSNRNENFGSTVTSTRDENYRNSNRNENFGSTITSTRDGNYTTRFRVIDMDLKTQLRIAKEKMNISDLESARTISKSYGNLKPETLITEEDLRSINHPNTNFNVMRSSIRSFPSKELIEHRPPNQTVQQNLISSPVNPMPTDFLDKRNHLVVGGGLHRKVAEPEPLPKRDDPKEQNPYTHPKVQQNDRVSLYRNDFSEHPHLSPISREAFLRMAEIDRLIALDKYRANAEKELLLRGLSAQNNNRASERPTAISKNDLGKVSTPQTNFDYRKHSISSVASSTVPSRSIQKTSGGNRPAEYPFYKFKSQTLRPPTSIQDVIAQTLGVDPMSISNKRERNSLEFNRFSNYNSRSPMYEQQNPSLFSNDYSYDENLSRLLLRNRPLEIGTEKKKIQGSLYHSYKNRKQYEHGTADRSAHDENLKNAPGEIDKTALTIQPASFEIFDVITNKNKKKNKNDEDRKRFSAEANHKLEDYESRSYEYSDRLRNKEENPIRYRTKNYDSFLTDESREAQRISGKRTRNNDNFYSKEARSDGESGLWSKYSRNDYPEVNDSDKYKYTSRSKQSAGLVSTKENVSNSAGRRPVAQASFEDAFDDTPGLKRRKTGFNSRRPFRKQRPESLYDSAELNGDESDEDKKKKSPTSDGNNSPNTPRKSLSAELEEFIRTKTKLPPTNLKSTEHENSDSLELESLSTTTENYSSLSNRRRRKPLIRRRNRFRSPLSSRNSDEDLQRAGNFKDMMHRRRRRPVKDRLDKGRSIESDVPPYAEDYTDHESRYRTKGLGKNNYEHWFERRQFRDRDKTEEIDAEQKRSNERRFYPEDEDMSVSPSMKHEATRTFMGLKRNTVSKFEAEKSRYDSTVEMLKAKRDAIGPKPVGEEPQKKIQTSVRSTFLPSDAIRNKVKRNDGGPRSETKEPQVITLHDVSGDRPGTPGIKTFNSQASSEPSFLKRIQDLSEEDDPIISNLKAVFLENANDHKKPIKTSFWNVDTPRSTEPTSVFNTPSPVPFTQKRKSVIRRKKIRRRPEFSQVSRMGLPLNSVEIITGKISQSNLPRKPHQRQHDVFSNNKLSSNTAPNLSITEGSAENKEEEQYESLSDLMPMRLVAPQPENLNSVASTEQVEDKFAGKTVDFSGKVSTEDVRSRPLERDSAGAASELTEHKGQMVYGESFSANQMRSEDLGRFSSASSDADRSLVPIGEIKLPGSGQKIIVETAVPEFFQSGPGSVINVLNNRGNEEVLKGTFSSESSEDEDISTDKLSIKSEESQSSNLDSSLVSFSSFSVPVPDAKTFKIAEHSTVIGQLSDTTKENSLKNGDKDFISVQNNSGLKKQELEGVASDQQGETQNFPVADSDHPAKGPQKNTDDILEENNANSAEETLNTEGKFETIEEKEHIDDKDASEATTDVDQLSSEAPDTSMAKIIPTTPVKRITIS